MMGNRGFSFVDLSQCICIGRLAHGLSYYIFVYVNQWALIYLRIYIFAYVFSKNKNIVVVKYNINKTKYNIVQLTTLVIS